MAANPSYVDELNRRVLEAQKLLKFCEATGKASKEIISVLQYMIENNNTDLEHVASKLKPDSDILLMKFNALCKLRDTGEEGVLNYKQLMSCFKPFQDTTVVSSTGVNLFHPADASDSASTSSALSFGSSLA